MILIEVRTSVEILLVIISNIIESKERIEVQQNHKEHKCRPQGHRIVSNNQNDLIKSLNLFDQI